MHATEIFIIRQVHFCTCFIYKLFLLWQEILKVQTIVTLRLSHLREKS